MTRFIIPPSKRVQAKPTRPKPKRPAYPDQREALADGLRRYPSKSKPRR